MFTNGYRNRYLIIIKGLVSLSIILFLFSNSVNAKDFSWKTLLLKNPETVANSLSTFADCGLPQPLTISLPEISEKTNVTRNLYRPVEGRLFDFSQRPVTVSEVSLINCNVKHEAEIQIIFWKQKAFQINIEYANCVTRLNSSDCNLKAVVESKYDAELFASVHKPLVYSFLSAHKKDQEATFQKYMPFYGDSDLKNLMYDAECGSGWIAAGSIAVSCIMDASSSDDIFQVLSIVELAESGWFQERVLARVASKQIFLSIPEYRSALDQIELQFKQIVAGRIEVLKRQRAATENQSNTISSALGSNQ